jgi:hypothetical protein
MAGPVAHAAAAEINSVIAGEAKQSISTQKRTDCFVAKPVIGGIEPSAGGSSR